MNAIPLEKLEKGLLELSTQYRNAKPYPRIIINNFLDQTVADQVFAEFLAINSKEWKNNDPL